ncbi:MAG: Rieske (2Fe-2S) protein [Phycisphaerales bacterium]|nr:Rieske (2Fe-2S) protein [Phycisphaerales bacterium]
MQTQRPPTRRTFLDGIIGFCSSIAGAAMALPAIAYLWPAARASGAESVELPGAKDMTPGQSAMIRVGSEAVVVVRDRNGFKAFSAVCTHLGCLVKWDAGGKRFLCPCHAAVFDENGHVVSGPPPSPLVKYVTKQVGDAVFVSAA